MLSKQLLSRLRAVVRLLCLAGMVLLVGCGSPAPAATTPAPAATSAAPQPAAVTAPAASPSAGAPSPVVSPAAAPKPAAQPTFAAFDEQAVATFYRGKTLRLIPGYAAGGLIDTYSRTISRYLSKYIPGTPTVVVENRGGAGSLTAANALFNTDPKDGTVLGSFAVGLVLVQAVKGPNI